jgi:ABC-type polysaccharide/polyol phosphate transport system ATPase subunit
MTVYRNESVPPGQPQIELRGVSRRYVMQRTRQRSLQESFIRLWRRGENASDVFWPLRDVSFAIHPGDCVGIIGPNGSGKSTLLKLITGILTPTAGDLTVNGRISSLLELGAGFHPDLTGRENIYLNGSIYGLTRREMDRRLDAIIDYAELGDFIDTPIKHYSSGMYVRLGFAVAIHTAPDLLLVDEVLAVGDAAFQRKCLSSIQRFRDNGGTLLLVSHDLNAIQSICRRVIWLEHGQIQADGHPTDVIMAYYRHLAVEEEARAAKKSDSKTVDSEESPQSPVPSLESPIPSQPRRWGNGQICITKVELCDGAGQPRTTFHNGDTLIVQLHYRTEGAVAQPVFGLAIHHQSGAHIAGPNTKFGELPLPALHGAGVIRYAIPALPLLEGTYSLSVAAANDTLTEVYDYHDRLYEFQVYRGRSQEQFGLVTLNGSWEHQTDAFP